MEKPKPRLSIKSPLFAPSILVFVLVCVVGVLFYRSLNPDLVVFSNDGPLGYTSAEPRQMPDGMFGVWNSLNWVGYYHGMFSPSISPLVNWLLGPLGCARVFAPLSILFLGLCAAFFFRRIGLSYAASTLGGVAAMLNTDFLSSATWGIVAWCTCIGMCFVAIGMLAKVEGRHRWIRMVIAGAALGLGLMEGFDVGAIFSLGVAAFIVYQALIRKGESLPLRLSKGALTTAIVAVVSALVAFQTIQNLVGTQIKGVSGMQAEERSTQERWDWATQWSLPKKEVLSVAVPGLFGYRMDTPDGGSYWGQVGRTPGWEEHRQGSPRFIGSGFYAGILVVIVALWALAQSFRRKDSVFSEVERKWIWFWGGVCGVSLLLSLGRYAPFYQVAYALPFFSTIRNPVKFVHVLSWALVVLFAYGVNGLVTGYASRVQQAVSGGSWWKRLSTFDRKWVAVSGTVFFGACVSWLIYASSRADLESYLVKEAIDPGLAPVVAGFSISSVGAFVLLFGIALALVTLVLAGFFRGSRANWAGVVLGLFLVFDLSRASQPWITYVNYKLKYATNPVIEFLRENPHEARVAGLPFPVPNEVSLLGQLYRIEWHQHHFPYFNIQSLDLVQMSRMPEEIAAFEGAFRPDPSRRETVSRVPRRWELTNTRYLLGPAGYVEVLNKQLDAGKGRFRVALAFEVVPKPGVANPSKPEDFTTVLSPTGRYAVIEFTGALPRASLYSNWQVETNDAAALELLASPEFNPAETVLVAGNIPRVESGQTNAAKGTVGIISYAPKQVVLNATNSVPSILLLNDKYDPNWKLLVDGQPSQLLRCNSVMRGVFLEPGEHTVKFSFEPPVGSLYVTVAAMGVSVLLLGFLIVANVRRSKASGDSG